MIYKDLGLPVKQMLGYLVGILLLTILFSVSTVHFSTIVSEYDQTMRLAWRHLNSLQDLRAYGLQVRLDLNENLPKAKRDLEHVTESFNSLLRGGAGGPPKDVMLIVQDMLAFRKQTLKLIELKEENTDPAVLAKEEAVFKRNYLLFMGRIYVEIEKSKANVAVTETTYLQRVSYLLLFNIILAPLSFAFLYIYGFFLSNYIGLRLQKFLASLGKIIGGDYKARIDDTSGDEIGKIAHGINELADRLDKKQ